MAITRVMCGDKVCLAYDNVTPESGWQIKLVNGTGVASVKGSLVSCSTTDDKKFVLQSNEYDTFGIVAESGVAANGECWVWKDGSLAQVLLKDGESATRAYLMIAADTDGRALNIAVPSVNPSVNEHFKEIGHSFESKASGTNILVLTNIHFL